MGKKNLDRGLIQIYTGDGKGKTTAAMGLALRMVGHGLQVVVIQFMKGTGYSGELFAAPRLHPLLEIEEFGRGCTWASMIKNGYVDCRGCGECFVKKGEGTEDDYEMMELALHRSREALTDPAYDLVILDEISNALYFELISVQDVLDLLSLKRDTCEVVLTGRNVPEEILEKGDLITEMKLVRHPFQDGVPARWGVEY